MSKSKGDRRERSCKEILESCGFKVEKRYNRRFGSNDYFGLFDLMATKRKQFRFLQVKSNSTAGALKEIEEGSSFLPFDLQGFLVEVWVCYDNAGWRIHRFTEEGWEVALDGRASSKNMGEEVKAWLT